MLNIFRKRARRLAVCLSIFFAVSATAPAFAEERVRKSIDDLTADELETYIHAVKALREKSSTNPSVQFSYAHMAGIHNIPELFDQACEHWSHRFLAWHRALLLNYEDALRASDPPRTSNVTIPYWNWSINPSGKRFPVGFENNPAGVKAKYGREIAAADLMVLFRSNRNTAASGPWYPWKEIAEIALNPSYEFFAGPATDHGALENPPHDNIHGFIGGFLTSTSTAADDPIFWSYHTFIDLVWWWRQQRIDELEACGDCSMRGMPIRTALGTRLNTEADRPPLLRHVADAKTLGFTYDFPVTVAMAAPRAQPSPESFSDRYPVLAEESLKKPDHVSSFTVAAPAQDAYELKIDLRDVKAAEAYAYVAFVYLHPLSVPFNGADKEFRNKYLVGHYAQFINLHAVPPEAANTRKYTVAANRSSYPALKVSAETPLTVTVAIHVNGSIADTRPAAGVEKPAGRAVPLPALADDARIGSAIIRGQ